jgi:hypothetical protein
LDGSSFGVLILTVSGVVNPSADQGQSLHFVTVREGLISPIIFVLFIQGRIPNEKQNQQ